MARTVTATPTVEEKKTVDVANKEQEIDISVEEKEVKKESVAINGNAKIHCAALVNRKIIGQDLNKPIEFNEKGIAEVDKEIAKYFLSIPGYELVK